MLLGVNGVVVVGHGRSDAGAVAWALRVARTCLETGVVPEIQRALATELQQEEVAEGGTSGNTGLGDAP